MVTLLYFILISIQISKSQISQRSLFLFILKCWDHKNNSSLRFYDCWKISYINKYVLCCKTYKFIGWNQYSQQFCSLAYLGNTDSLKCCLLFLDLNFRTKNNAYELHTGRFPLMTRKIFLMNRSVHKET